MQAKYRNLLKGAQQVKAPNLCITLMKARFVTTSEGSLCSVKIQWIYRKSQSNKRLRPTKSFRWVTPNANNGIQLLLINYNLISIQIELMKCIHKEAYFSKTKTVWCVIRAVWLFLQLYVINWFFSINNDKIYQLTIEY